MWYKMNSPILVRLSTATEYEIYFGFRFSGIGVCRNPYSKNPAHLILDNGKRKAIYCQKSKRNTTVEALEEVDLRNLNESKVCLGCYSKFIRMMTTGNILILHWLGLLNEQQTKYLSYFHFQEQYWKWCKLHADYAEPAQDIRLAENAEFIFDISNRIILGLPIEDVELDIVKSQYGITTFMEKGIIR